VQIKGEGGEGRKEREKSTYTVVHCRRKRRIRKLGVLHYNIEERKGRRRGGGFAEGSIPFWGRGRGKKTMNFNIP